MFLVSYLTVKIEISPSSNIWINLVFEL